MDTRWTEYTNEKQLISRPGEYSVMYSIFAILGAVFLTHEKLVYSSQAGVTYVVSLSQHRFQSCHGPQTG